MTEHDQSPAEEMAVLLEAASREGKLQAQRLYLGTSTTINPRLYLTGCALTGLLAMAPRVFPLDGDSVARIAVEQADRALRVLNEIPDLARENES